MAKQPRTASLSADALSVCCYQLSLMMHAGIGPEEGVEVLRAGMGRYRDTRRAMALVGRLEEIRRSLDFHVGAGHVAGWLCAGSF